MYLPSSSPIKGAIKSKPRLYIVATTNIRISVFFLKAEHLHNIKHGHPITTDMSDYLFVSHSDFQNFILIWDDVVSFLCEGFSSYSYDTTIDFWLHITEIWLRLISFIYDRSFGKRLQKLRSWEDLSPNHSQRTGSTQRFLRRYSLMLSAYLEGLLYFTYEWDGDAFLILVHRCVEI